MNKTLILKQIIFQLVHDLEVLMHAAKTAHEASTHEENIPDNKYETLALEASYLAQGQANRAQEIKLALSSYKQLELLHFDNESAIRLTALVTLEGKDGSSRVVFIGPLEGGLKVTDGQTDVVVISPLSPLGRELIGKSLGDVISAGIGAGCNGFEIMAIS